MIECLQAMLAVGSGSPYLLALLLIVATFILEDAAVISAALLINEGLIAYPLALSAVFAGIVLGDYGLYALGYAAKRYAWAKRFLAKAVTQRFQAWLLANVWFALFASRFVPGMRLPVYTLSGGLGLGFSRFALVIFVSNLIWVPSLLYVVYRGGSTLTERFADYGYAVWLLPVLVLYGLNRGVKRWVDRSF